MASPASGQLVRIFAHGLAWVGPGVLLIVLATDTAWVRWWPVVLIIAAITLLLRAFNISLGKYAYLAPSGIVALSGMLLVGPETTALGLALGTIAADWGVLRKRFAAALVNTGREILSVIAAYGLYALAVTLTDASNPLSREAVPALAILVLGYFAAWRSLFYYTLLIRGKLSGDERLLILRYEIIAGGLIILAAAITVFTISQLPNWISWLFIFTPMCLAGVMFKSILEEAIQAEELNKLHAMDAVITGTANLEDSLARIERLVHRILDWGDFRIYAYRGHEMTMLYRGGIGRPDRGDPEPVFEELRTNVVRTGETVVVGDTERDPRLMGLPATIRSVVVQPLRLGGELIGTLELEHHKRKEYRRNQLALLDACAHRVATAVHIADLRRPLVETVARIATEVKNLRRATESLRATGGAMRDSSSAIGTGLSQQDLEVASGLTATEELSDAGKRVVGSSAQAEQASRQASEVAQRSRETIRDAIEKLVDLKAFVAESSRKVGDLEDAARQIVKFIVAIREVADMTNLLALNAGIEAARAGEHGRGFAVVAAEIRRLAEQTGETADEAGELVANLQLVLGDVVEQMRRGQGSVAGVEQMSTEGLNALDSIVSATEDATEHARRIARTAEGQQSAFVGLRERINTVAVISSRNRSGADDVIERAEDVSKQLDEMGQATRELEAVADMLADLTERFTFAESHSGV